jgi:carbon storage regulator
MDDKKMLTIFRQDAENDKYIYGTCLCLIISYQGGKYMLVLGRKPGEYVMIGDNVKVEVVKSKDGDLRLAIDAPREISITRGEIYEQQLSDTIQ